MRLRIGFAWGLDATGPAHITATVAPYPAGTHRIIAERRSTTPDVPIRTFIDGFGNAVWRWDAPEGHHEIRHDLIVEIDGAPDPVLSDLPGTLVADLPDETLVYTLASRHVPSDLVIAEAWERFGDVPDGWARVQAICDWAHANIEYGYGNSTVTTTGYDALQNRKGVCRDFAHIGVMFCRALNIPARYVYGYLPDIDVPYNPIPMDFHAWFEAYIAGQWRTFDARHNVPRVGRVVIAYGRDAIDTALMTTYGECRLTGFTVWADEVGPEVTLDTPLPTPAFAPHITEAGNQTLDDGR